MYALLTGRGIALKDAARDCAIFHWGGRRSVCTLLMGSPAALSVAGAAPEAAVCVSATAPSRSAALGGYWRWSGQGVPHPRAGGAVR